MTKTLEAVGEKIRKCLAERQLVYTTVGRALGLHSTTIGCWCRGDHLPKPYHQKKLIEYLEEIDKNLSFSPFYFLVPSDFRELNHEYLQHKQQVILQTLAQKKIAVSA